MHCSTKYNGRRRTGEITVSNAGQEGETAAGKESSLQSVATRGFLLLQSEVMQEVFTKDRGFPTEDRGGKEKWSR